VTKNPWQKIGLICAGIIVLVCVKFMYDMGANMARMTDHVGSLARDVSEMKSSMDGMAEDMAKMSESMQRIDVNIHGMGNAVQQGGKVFQQWDPARMMQQ
jgi:methyl-accepting chemotaxis protein